MGKQGLIAGTALAIALSSTAFAQDDEERATYISILGSYSLMDENRDGAADGIDDAMGGLLIFGQQRASGFGIEATISADLIETGSGNGTDYYRPGLGLDLLYGFGDRKSFTPFVLVGAGGMYNDVSPDSADDYDWFANAGLGFVTGPLNKYDVKIRFELRYIYDNFMDGYDDYKAGLGLEIPLYGEPKTIEKIVETVKVVEVKAEGFGDADNDGIIDNRDQCPNTPEGTRVDGTGCPLGDVVG
ncbi:MAG: outer membrane beta-barrel protein, partial [Oceanococcus sp.]